MCYSSQLVHELTEGQHPSSTSLGDRIQAWAKATGAKNIYYASAFNRPIWPVITADTPGSITELQWGLVPSWAKDPNAFLRKAMTYNAKSETVAEKPSFRRAMIKGRRCLIPVSGFFEWQHVGKVKYPYFIHVKSAHFFRLAGVYENGTYSILTTSANPLMARIHNTKKRMPVILTEVDGEAWLDPTLSAADVKQLCIPYPADDMEAWTVSRDITSRTANPDTPAAHRLMEYPELGGADGRLAL